MAAGRKTGGRKKGTPNKMTIKAKEAIEIAADGIGGTGRLVEWVKEDPGNERIFWAQIYTKLLPLQVDANVKARLTVVLESDAENL